MELLFPEGHRVAQLGVGRQRDRDLACFICLEDAEHEFASERVEFIAVVGNHHWRHLLSESNPRRIQLLTLPSGALMRSAICECDKPSTKASRMLGREMLSDDPALGDEALEPDVIEKLDALAQAGALRRCLKLLDDEQRRCPLERGRPAELRRHCRP
jgi:hypothetical protein